MASLFGPTRTIKREMAEVAIKMKILPESVEVDLSKLKKACEKEIKAFGGEVHKVEEQPIAFGLKALEFMFILDESKGGTDPLEEKLVALPGVRSAEVTDVRRMFG